MQKSGIAFRFRRDAIGLSQQDIADAVDVSRRTVKYWEQDAYSVPEDAWEYLSHMEKVFQKGVTAGLLQVAEVTKQLGTAPNEVALTYFRSQEDYDRYGRDAGSFGFRNAMTREIARKLKERGQKIRVIDPAK